MKRLFIMLFSCALLLGCAEQLFYILGEKKAAVDYQVLYHGYIVQAGAGFMQIGSNWRPFRSAEEFAEYIEDDYPLDLLISPDEVNFAREDLYYYGIPRGFDARGDVSHIIKAVYTEPHFEVVFAEDPTAGVAYQIFPNDGANVCVREVFLLTVPKKQVE